MAENIEFADIVPIAKHDKIDGSSGDEEEKKESHQSAEQQEEGMEGEQRKPKAKLAPVP